MPSAYDRWLRSCPTFKGIHRSSSCRNLVLKRQQVLGACRRRHVLIQHNDVGIRVLCVCGRGTQDGYQQKYKGTHDGVDHPLHSVVAGGGVYEPRRTESGVRQGKGKGVPPIPRAAPAAIKTSSRRRTFPAKSIQVRSRTCSAGIYRLSQSMVDSRQSTGRTVQVDGLKSGSH